MTPSSLYIHIPFCARKCAYCSFFSKPVNEYDTLAYVKAVIQELRRYSDIGFKTVYIGGGTPTCLPAPSLEYLMTQLERILRIAPDTEFTVEANPGTLDAQCLDLLLRAGVNRISLGCQSFDDKRLDYLGRIHDSRTSMLTVEALRKAGCDNINLDLIYGYPDQDLESLQEDINQACGLEPEHMSWYELSIEPNTPLAGRPETAGWSGNPELSLAMDECIREGLTAGGYRQYEVSSYARPGKECRHNTAYWLGKDYAGAGAGAVSLEENCRIRRYDDIKKYIDAVEQGLSLAVEEEALDTGTCQREMLMMGLRLTAGIRADDFKARTGIPLERHKTVIQELCARNLLNYDGKRLCATSKGLSVLNTILVEFFSNID